MKDITAVIMAAGKGTRLQPLTHTTPKPLIRILGKTPLEHNLENLVGKVDEIVIVVNHLKEKIIKYIGHSFKGIKIKYVYQKDPAGTAHALFVTKDQVKTKNILVMNGDDIYEREIIRTVLKKDSPIIVGKKETNWQNFGVLKTKNDNTLHEIIEKPRSYVGSLVNIGLYKVEADIFSYFSKIKKSPRGEFEITDMLSNYAKEKKVEVIGINSGWYPITFPWDLLKYAEEKLEKIKPSKKGVIEKNVEIKGKLHLGEGSVIKSGSYLEGNFYIAENCTIGPNSFLKGFGVIDQNTNIGFAVEITRSIIGRNTNIKHLSYVGDSVIGNNVNLGAGTIISNLRHDRAEIMFDINGKLVNTKKEKFGAVIGDFVKTGINTLLYPGTKFNPYTTTLPGQVVKYNLDTLSDSS